MPTPHYGQPRYRAIADELRQRIESGSIPPGTLLPPEGVLTAEFRASRGTIRQAIAVLREDGLTSTAHGRGTFVNVRPQPPELSKPGDLETRKREVAADEELATLFGVEAGEVLIMHENVTRRNGEVEVVARTYRLHRSHH
ncbi:GntR family transcriptional regulator [Verrucosispora sp. WMMD573]|uniref:GntR family transcriptional regulator n=1 Tax=Verrucosispora sp. WMMD573 TaxID=3015149 RepID=UPI00248BFA7E|nr:GntR family transcriptional regulator [Verrucosispora sp. WMMD573]WBB54350.1 GntR family transcriptional regulator [Verrucosispora sp. WMMD573]